MEMEEESVMSRDGMDGRKTQTGLSQGSLLMATGVRVRCVCV